MMPSGLYGLMNGIPIVRMSVWPSTGTRCWAWTCSSVRSCTDGVKPACTLVIAYGASMPWKILRLARFGMRFSDFCGRRGTAPGPSPSTPTRAW